MQETLTKHVNIVGRRTPSRGARGFRRFMANRGAVLGLSLLLLVAGLALFAPHVAPYDPIKLSLSESLEGPSSKHWMGTDLMGRDILSRMIFGGRLSLQLGFLANAFSLAVGLVAGLFSGYYGGWVDSFVMRAMDVLLALPTFLLALAAIAVLGPSFRNTILATGIAWIPGYARLVRGCVLSAKEDLYVTAAVSVGAPSSRIMFVHILPNVVAPIVVLFTIGVGTAILFGSALGFIGMGAQPPTPEWGVMLAEGRELMRRAWWVTVFPGLAIMVTSLGVNLLGDGLRGFVDPRLRIRVQ